MARGCGAILVVVGYGADNGGPLRPSKSKDRGDEPGAEGAIGSAGGAAGEWLKIADIAPWEANPRRNNEAIEPVARSIARFGFGAPVLVRREGLGLIAGHTRIAALQLLAEKVLTDDGRWRKRRASDGPFVVPGAAGPGLVPARILDLSAGEARALALADNRLGELAEWDDGKLADALRGLSAAGARIDGLGWDPGDLDELVAVGPPPPPGELGGPARAHSGNPIYAVILEFSSERDQESAYNAARDAYPGATIRTVVA